MPTAPSLILHSYWRSSASYRVRMALALKGLAHEIRPVHLVRDGGQQHSAAYLGLNPQGLVPTLVHGDRVITQSLAILEYLEEIAPEPALLPSDPAGRARVRAICQAIACDIHPLNNLRVLGYLVRRIGVDEQAKLAWYRHWTETGLAAVERLLSGHSDTGLFCHGDQPGLADCCLLPQVYNARRFDCSLDGLDTIQAICSRLEDLVPVRESSPEAQLDAE